MSGKTAKPDSRLLLKPAGNLLAFGFGSGLAPVAPGTFGTLAAIPLYLLLAGLDVWSYAAVVVVAFIVGIPLCRRAAESLDTHDHPAIVWDEFVGLWVTLWLVPFSWWNLLLGFLLFRLFDILKPWPIRAIDNRVHGGFGIMLDDVIAAVFANLLLQLLLRLF